MKSTLILGALAMLAASPSYAEQLEVVLKGVQHDKGQLRVGLYAEPKTFRKERLAFATQQAAAKRGEVGVVFDDVPPGRYAIMAYHDENSNGELDRRFGMFPTEGYALSNNPKVMGPPAFDDSAFDVGNQPARLELQMRY